MRGGDKPERSKVPNVFGRTLKASIAKDNGRTSEFIRRKDYPNKTRCYECGEFGHLSYKCDRNLLGEREPPPKKIRKRKKKVKDPNMTQEEKEYFDSTDEEANSDKEVVEDCETLSAAIALEQEKKELEMYRYKVATGNYDEGEAQEQKPRKRIKKSDYFSDEEESD